MKNRLNISTILIFQTSQIIPYNSSLFSLLTKTKRDFLTVNAKLAQFTYDRLKLI